jgi:hypothetical protein
MDGYLIAGALVINGLATSYLFHIVKRGPKRKFRNLLRSGTPITPRHEPPPELGDAWGVTDADKRFFADFESFADILNNSFARLQDPWRLQELPDAEIRGGGRDSPQHGRRYLVFYNQIRVGNLNIYAHHLYAAHDPTVHTYISLEYARLLPFHQVGGFIMSVADLTVSDTSDGIRKSRVAMHDAMLNQFWQIEYDYDLDARSSGGFLDVSFTGSAAHYLKTIAAVQGHHRA